MNHELFLYVHFPWCIRKCPYCDFNSHELKGELPERNYIETLIQDFDNDLKHLSTRPKLNGIFLGGGTPSLFSGHGIKSLLTEIQSRIVLKDSAEVTMEVNPGAVEHDRFETYLDAGINRLSFGAQSFCDKQLAKLGRVHRSQHISTSISAAKKAGFSNFNIDLMYGLPDQDIREAIDDCQQAIDLGPSHLSLYQLTIEPNTWFHRFPPTLPEQDKSVEIQDKLVELTQSYGFDRYEVSAYAKPGYQSRHNLNYWLFGDYLGIGAGAHSKITQTSNQGKEILRGYKEKHPKKYVNQIAKGERARHDKRVGQNEILFEFMMNALRLKNGFSLDLATKQTRLNTQTLIAALQPAIDKNWITLSPNHMQCSHTGYLFLDEILMGLLPD